jgi:hypothetical protein
MYTRPAQPSHTHTHTHTSHTHTHRQVRKFAAEQYAAAGLHLHHSSNPVSVSKQPNGKLSLVVKGLDGATSTLTDLDQVMMATGEVAAFRNGACEQCSARDWKGGKGLPVAGEEAVGCSSGGRLQQACLRRQYTGAATWCDNGGVGRAAHAVSGCVSHCRCAVRPLAITTHSWCPCIPTATNAGRVPKTSGLGLEEAGVKLGSKGQVGVVVACVNENQTGGSVCVRDHKRESKT